MRRLAALPPSKTAACAALLEADLFVAVPSAVLVPLLVQLEPQLALRVFRHAAAHELPLPVLHLEDADEQQLAVDGDDRPCDGTAGCFLRPEGPAGLQRSSVHHEGHGRTRMHARKHDIVRFIGDDVRPVISAVRVVQPCHQGDDCALQVDMDEARRSAFFGVVLAFTAFEVPDCGICRTHDAVCVEAQFSPLRSHNDDYIIISYSTLKF